MSKIGGRFEFDSASGQLEVWFTTGTHCILGPEQTFDKVLRGEIPIKETGGQATAKSKLTWHQQLEGKADGILAGAKVKRYDGRGRLKLSLSDLDLTSLLADLVPKEDQ